MVNVELLMETLEYIKDNPQKWLQEAWFALIDPKTGNRVWDIELFDVEEINSCGSAFCFAGHAALKSGFCAPPKSPNSAWRMDINGRDVWVEDYAREQLGLTHEQAGVLFAADNSLEDLETIVKAIIDNPEISQYELEEKIGREVDEDDEYEDIGCGDPDCWCQR